MPFLSAPTQQFEVVLGEAISIANCDWVACYRDTDVNGRTSKPQVTHGSTNGVSAFLIFAGPATGIRTLVSLSVKNKDNIAHGIIVQLNDTEAVVVKREVKQSTNAASSLLYNERRGWYLFPTAATATAVTSVSASSPISSTGGTTPTIGLTVGGNSAAAGQYPSNDSSGTLTNKNPLDDAGVTGRLGGSGAPSASIGNVGSTYFDIADAANLAFYYKT